MIYVTTDAAAAAADAETADSVMPTARGDLPDTRHAGWDRAGLLPHSRCGAMPSTRAVERGCKKPRFLQRVRIARNAERCYYS